ncbi:hypothetical protein DPEC_G00361820 [Dallia pectoralis]|nr:hypothetical protein DPEC_G00361820 [Dallia pectoralis]
MHDLACTRSRGNRDRLSSVAVARVSGLPDSWFEAFQQHELLPERGVAGVWCELVSQGCSRVIHLQISCAYPTEGGRSASTAGANYTRRLKTFGQADSSRDSCVSARSPFPGMAIGSRWNDRPVIRVLARQWCYMCDAAREPQPGPGVAGKRRRIVRSSYIGLPQSSSRSCSEGPCLLLWRSRGCDLALLGGG